MTNRFGLVVHGRVLSSRRSQNRIAEFYPYTSKRHMDELKRAAAKAVAEALRTGRLVRKPCRECGAKAEGHHEDYAKPLDVMWLCRYHHRRREAELREIRRRAVRRIAGLPVHVIKKLQSVAPLVVPVERKKERRSLMECTSTTALVRQATAEISAALDAEGISERRLAVRMKVSSQVVNSQFAAGFRTLKVLAAYADALGYDAVIALRKRHSSQSQVAS